MRLIRVLMLPVTTSVRPVWVAVAWSCCQILPDCHGPVVTSYWQTETGPWSACVGRVPVTCYTSTLLHPPTSTHYAHNEQIISVQFIVHKNVGPFPESYSIFDWIAKLVNIRFYWPRNYFVQKNNICIFTGQWLPAGMISWVVFKQGEWSRTYSVCQPVTGEKFRPKVGFIKYLDSSRIKYLHSCSLGLMLTFL